MKFLYVIINFIILLLILFFAGRKTVKKIFGTRRERIIRELDEAEAIENTPLPVFSENELPLDDEIPEEKRAEF